jgi:hypothetical protein
MRHASSLPAAALVAFAVALGLTGAVAAQDAPKPGDVGCTMVNGVPTGPGCEGSAGSSAAGAVENGMPATKHQQELLKTDDQAAQGQNMQATGAGGAQLPATEHQSDLLKQQPGAGGNQTGTSP